MDVAQGFGYGATKEHPEPFIRAREETHGKNWCAPLPAGCCVRSAFGHCACALLASCFSLPAVLGCSTGVARAGLDWVRWECDGLAADARGRLSFHQARARVHGHRREHGEAPGRGREHGAGARCCRAPHEAALVIQHVVQHANRGTDSVVCLGQDGAYFRQHPAMPAPTLKGLKQTMLHRTN
eukprot:3053007-Rhodomonas_salina.1